MSVATTAHTDFDLHGLIGVRLVDAAAGDCRAVERQLGVPPCQLARDPDLVIRFVEQLPLGNGLRYLGVDEVGFTEEAFVVLRGQQKSRVKVVIPFATVGSACTIVCESGLRAVPMLIATINVRLVAKGIVPLHASAFVVDGVGVLVTGWSKGGKTEALLAFMEQGAQYVGDEWVYLDHSSGLMYGIPEPVRVWSWHLEHVPGLRRHLRRSERMRLAMLEVLIRSGQGRSVQGRSGRIRSGRVRSGRSGKDGGTRAAGLMQRARALMAAQQFVNVPPARLFGTGRCAPRASLDTVFLVVSGAGSATSVRPIDATEIGRRMVHSLQYERRDFMAAYRQFRFAFPNARNDFLERIEQVESELLAQALADRRAFVVDHPYPVRIQSLFETMRPHVAALVSDPC